MCTLFNITRLDLPLHECCTTHVRMHYVAPQHGTYCLAERCPAILNLIRHPDLIQAAAPCWADNPKTPHLSVVVPPVHEEHGVQVKGVTLHLRHDAISPLVPWVKLLVEGHQLACMPCTDSRACSKHCCRQGCWHHQRNLVSTACRCVSRVLTQLSRKSSTLASGCQLLPSLAALHLQA